jgi:hypothetical protein
VVRPSSRIRAAEVKTLAKLSCGLLLLLAVTASSAWSADAAPRNVGFVLDLSGQCFRDGSRHPLEVGQRLPAGATLHFSSGYKSADFVEVALRDGTKLSGHCSDLRRCDCSVRIPRTTEDSSIMHAEWGSELIPVSIAEATNHGCLVCKES